MFRDRPSRPALGAWRCRRGFTLLEVVVALAVGALVVLVAERLFTSVADASHRLAVARTTLDRTENARRWLAAALGSVEVDAPSGQSFEGHADRATFTTWLRTSGGWWAPVRLTIGLSDGRLVAAPVPGNTLVLADSVTSVGLDYLLAPRADSPWAWEWVSGVSAPLAVRVRVTKGAMADTLLFVIGERG